MRAVLVWIKDQYGNPDVYVTENGFSDRTGQINDADRVDYYKYYINNVMQGWCGFHGNNNNHKNNNNYISYNHKLFFC